MFRSVMHASTCRAICLIGIVVSTASLTAWAEGPVVERVAAENTKPIADFDVSQLPVGRTVLHSAGEGRVRETLDKPAEFDLNGVTLRDFIAQVMEKHRIGIVIDMEALTADEKGPDTVLTAKLRDTTLRVALQSILKDHGLAFLLRDDVLVVTTTTAATSLFTTQVYQVHDLVVRPDDPTRRPDFNSLIELITSTIQEDTSREVAGTIGEFKSFEGPGIMTLVITHTEGTHVQIEQLLADLRAAKAPQVLDLQKRRQRGDSPKVSTPPVDTRRFPQVDGITTKGEYIELDADSSERLYYRYGSITDSGVELEKTANGIVVWRVYVSPLGVAHSKYSHVVDVYVKDGKVVVTSVGARRIIEVRALGTGEIISREVDDLHK